MAAPVIIVPGYGDSGPQHWQTVWAQRGGYRRVQQRDWWKPQRDEWVNALQAEIQACAAAPILVGHSLGCITIAAWASAHVHKPIHAALLVAPADSDTLGLLCPVPQQRLAFPSVVVASRNDPYCSWSRSEQFAHNWGSRLVDLGRAGHINVDAGFGEWPFGEQLLAELQDAQHSSLRVAS